MAAKDIDASTKPRGEALGVKNPEPAPKVGAKFEGTTLSIRCTGRTVTGSIIGIGSYDGGARTTTMTHPLSKVDLAPLKDLLTSLLEQYEGEIADQTMEATYEASSVARRRNELN